MMRKSTLFSCIACLLLLGFQPAPFIEAIQESREQTPSYAKWGQLAMKRTKEAYPKADIVDYLHVGRQEGPVLTTEKFKLWLKEGNAEFGVEVTISFYSKSEAVKEVKLKKEDRR
ncbi:DUF3889 domain-containing protein [Sutcliffiella horikoshii]|uniref:DUF3889 domain-containing protein n=1 Tax=Sutcliffiella horikoshii TaxID=79883 RepID=UPI001F4175AF|nr:DUF3889 domain-containing protein [Sutcliffiella horikoshii]